MPDIEEISLTRLVAMLPVPTEVSNEFAAELGGLMIV
jgi:hypothetical protein